MIDKQAIGGKPAGFPPTDAKDELGRLQEMARHFYDEDIHAIAADTRQSVPRFLSGSRDLCLHST